MIKSSTACAQVTKSARIDVIWKSISSYGIFSPSKLKVKTSGCTQSND